MGKKRAAKWLPGEDGKHSEESLSYHYHRYMMLCLSWNGGKCWIKCGAEIYWSKNDPSDAIMTLFRFNCACLTTSPIILKAISRGHLPL